MHLDELREALSSELSPSIPENIETKLASVLIVIFGSEPKILMTNDDKLQFFVIDFDKNAFLLKVSQIRPGIIYLKI